ncbi:enoyl-CoA hydratase-related protein [Falsihalocynthiibacter sp. SS001]|uniref:enoyl-CoA hydratase-related protein n=1 Tax=Falsihalocynthiibacter sp. SS001 TaxID=3349698 RepID=UPI0036D2EE3D
MNYQMIRVSLRDGISIITMNRPDVMNALNPLMRAELTHAIRDMGKQARVVVLTGNGRAFCAGQDLGDGVSAANADLERTLRDEYEPLLRVIYECPVPTIAAVNGAAAGAGANLALACDVTIATQSAVFLQAFARIGLIPDAGGTYWLPKQVGFAKAMGAALFAEPITAEEASNMGMIYEAVADEDFADHWHNRAQTLATGPTQAYARIKEALRASYDNTLQEQLTLEAKLQGRAGQTRDFKEGVVAFVEKRKAQFEGR